MASNKGYPRCDVKVSEEERDFNEMKNRACEFYTRNKVPQQIENVLNEMFFAKPDDIYGYLANFFMKLSAPPRISGLNGREVYDSQGQLAVQAEVMCTIRNEQKLTSCAGVPAGNDQWRMQGPDLGKGRAHHITTGLEWIKGPLSELLKGCDPCDQTGVDNTLSDFFSARHQEDKETRRSQEEKNKEAEEEALPPPPPPPVSSKGKKAGETATKGASAEKLIPPCVPPEPEVPGSLAVGAVSLAVAKSGALIRDVPLYKHILALRSQSEFRVPVPLVTLLSCGKSSPGKLNLLEEVILIPRPGQRVAQVISMALQIHEELMRIMNSSTSKAGPTQAGPMSEAGAPVLVCERPEQALDLVVEACGNLGLTPGEEIRLALNCAADRLMDYSKGKYEVIAGSLKSPDELVDMYQALLLKYPAVAALIQPLRKEDVDQWERLSSVIGASCSLLCDMSGLSASRAPPPALPGVKGQVLQQVNGTKVSDLIRIMVENPDAVILSSSHSEPCGEDCLSDLAVGLGVAYVRLGGLQGGHRLAKYNRLIAIEEELAQQGALVSRTTLPAPLCVRVNIEDAGISEEL
ncbi:enolase 4 isoform X2 [Gadus macrocephalus]|uniref:enolase 4 isoform X2 n=1 Tax=Gadus macrocephalus TaxID=80720 RepID=UPI0028CB9583|nr:enolase 4 isoform X2 [Gadus macrocephalus]